MKIPSGTRECYLLRAGPSNRELSKPFHLLSDDLNSSFIGGVELQHSLSVQLWPEAQRREKKMHQQEPRKLSDTDQVCSDRIYEQFDVRADVPAVGLYTGYYLKKLIKGHGKRMSWLKTRVIEVYVWGKRQINKCINLLTLLLHWSIHTKSKNRSLTHKGLWQQLGWWRSFLFQEGHRTASWGAMMKTHL